MKYNPISSGGGLLGPHHIYITPIFKRKVQYGWFFPTVSLCVRYKSQSSFGYSSSFQGVAVGILVKGVQKMIILISDLDLYSLNSWSKSGVLWNYMHYLAIYICFSYKQPSEVISSKCFCIFILFSIVIRNNGTI